MAAYHDSTADAKAGWATWFLRGLVLLVAAGAIGFAGYYFYWSVRLPQERLLTGGKGETLHVRIEGRTDKMLKVALLDDDGRTAYYSIEYLLPDDQKFVNRLPVNLTLEYPLDYTLTTAGPKDAPRRLEDKTDKMIKMSAGAGSPSRWILLDTFAPADQQFFANLPMGAGFNYPFTQDFTDEKGKTFTAEILGHDDTLVQITTKADGLTRLVPLASFSAGDQALLKALPGQPAFQIPVNTVLTDKTGKTIAVALEGRTADLVSYNQLDNSKSYLVPIQRWSVDDQTLIRQFPQNDQLKYPFLTVLTDTQGQSMELTILGRTASNLTVTRAGDKEPSSYDIAKLSKDDQAFARLLPVTDDGGGLLTAAATPTSAPDIKPLRDELAVMQQQLTDLLEEKKRVAKQPLEAATNEQNIISKQLQINQSMASIIHMLAKASNTPAALRVDKTVADLRDKIVALDNQLDDAMAHAKIVRGVTTLPVVIQQAQTELDTAQIQLNEQYKEIISRVK